MHRCWERSGFRRYKCDLVSQTVLRGRTRHVLIGQALPHRLQGMFGLVALHRRERESCLTFHLLSSCGKCHFKSVERCSLDWVPSHHIRQVAETARVWLGEEAALGRWTPAPLPVLLMWPETLEASLLHVALMFSWYVSLSLSVSVVHMDFFCGHRCTACVKNPRSVGR